MKKKILASLLSLCLLIGLMPSAAFAGTDYYHSEKAIAETDATDSEQIIEANTEWNEAQTLSGDLVVESGVTLTINAPVTISGTVTISGGGTIKRGVACKTDLITVSDGSTLTCRDITIDGGAIWTDAKNQNTGVVAEGALILSNGTFLMENGAVLRNNDYRTSSKESGALHLAKGTAKVSGGTIRCNYGVLYGAGVVVETEAELTFSDGTVSENHSTDGGGIFVWGKAEISGGEICGNSTDSIGGGIRIATGGKIEMTGGTIFENEAVSGGGGVHVYGKGSIFTMSGGEICNNTVIGNGPTGPNALQGGGGIATINGGNVILSGSGNIHHNDAGRGNGGGIRIGNGGSIEMTGGIISHNTSTNTGSGLYTWNSSVVLNGGLIQNNIVSLNNDSVAGGGVYLNGNGNVSVGDIIITENLAKKDNTVFPEYDLVFQLLDYNKLTLSKANATGTPCIFCVLDYDNKGQYGKPENFSFSTPENFSVDVLKDLRYKSVSVEENFQPWYDSNDKKIYLAKVVTNGGTFTEDTTYENDELSSPNKGNYSFGGWYTDADLTESASSYQQGGTYYAKWLSRIIFDANGGTFEEGADCQSIDMAEGQSYEAPFPEPTRADYHFDGWYADEYLTQKAESPYTPAGNTTLYAKWEKEIKEDLYFVSPHIEDQTYTGEAITPDVEVYENDNLMEEGTYDVEYANNIHAGTAAAIVSVDGIEIGTATFTIKKASLTVTAKDVEIPVGGELPKEYSYSISGWKGSDTDSLLTGISAVCENADSNTAGTYPITVSGPTEIDNYTIDYKDGTLTVSEKPSGGGIIIPPSGDHVVHNPSSDTTTADINLSVNADGTAKVTVSESLADKIVANAVRNQVEEVVLDATTYGSRAKAVEVKFPAEAIKELLSETDAELTVKTDAADLHLDREVMKQIFEKAESGSITFSIEKEKEESNALYLDLHITAEQGEVTDFGSGTAEITVKLPYALYDKEVTAVYIDDKGIYEKIGGVKNKDNTFTFTTDHFSSYAVMETAEADKIIKEQTDEKNKRLIKGVENTAIKLTYRMSEIGKGWIKIRWTKEKGYAVDYYEVYRSSKNKHNFGKKPYFKTKTNKMTGTYKNTKGIKKGTRYYYKVRGVREIEGKKYYTKWSNTTWRTGR